MKLELKHLAPYLPYKLLGKTSEKTNHLLTPHLLHLLFNQHSEAVGRKITFEPFLRPLSDLIKEIEHNGERFVPIEKISKEFGDSPSYLTLPILKDGTIEIRYYYEYLRLFEWHFDIFNLIENGLAIDINTI